MRGEKLTLSVVGLAGAAARATGWGVVATACELALKSADVGRAIGDIGVMWQRRRMPRSGRVGSDQPQSGKYVR